jgi:hypothetical protein
MPLIRQRPAAVEDRAVPGHWEGDLLSGPNNTYIATLVERQTRYVTLAKVAGKPDDVRCLGLGSPTHSTTGASRQARGGSWYPSRA